MMPVILAAVFIASWVVGWLVTSRILGHPRKHCPACGSRASTTVFPLHDDEPMRHCLNCGTIWPEK